MNFLYVSKKKQQNSVEAKLTGIIIVMIIALIIIIWRLPLFSFFASLWKGETFFLESASVAMGWFGDNVELNSRIDELQTENDMYKTRIIELEAKELAYYDLIDEIDISTSTDIDGMIAKIIRRPPFTVFDTYIIDKGESDGIKIGDKAYAYGMIVGEVKNVAETNAVINLYSSPREKKLLTFGTSSIQYEAQGNSNGVLRTDIPKDANVQNGMVVTAGDRNATLYGTVSAIEDNSDGATKAVFISLPFDINDTGWFVIKK